jgi:hypothetical protein
MIGGPLDPEQIDLSALDPAADEDRWERLVRDIESRAAFELARRSAATPIALLARWSRPALPFAAMLAAVSAFGLAVASRPAAAASRTGVAEALAPSGPAYTWLTEDTRPAASDLLEAMQDSLP